MHANKISHFENYYENMAFWFDSIFLISSVPTACVLLLHIIKKITFLMPFCDQE